MAQKKGLSARERAFAEEYLTNGGNKYKAALAAGYKETTARARSYELIDRPDVAEYIADRRRQMAANAVTPEKVLLELAQIGFGTKTFTAYTPSGEAYERRPAVGARLKALELMGKNLGLFDPEKTVDGEGVQIIDDL